MVKPVIKVVYCLLFTVYCLLFFSCRKGGSPSWDVDVIAPLVKSSLTINNIIPDSLLNINPDNSYDIVYNTSLYSFSIIEIPETTITNTVPLFGQPISPCSTIISSVNDQTKYDLKGVELTKVIIRSGDMKVVITNNSDGNIEFNYKIPLATLGFQSFDTTFIVPKRIGTNPGIYSETFDLSGYIFDLRGLSGDSYNTIIKTTSAKLPCTEPPLVFQTNDYCKIANSFINIVPGYAKGYFGQKDTILADTSDFSLFNHIIDGTLNLEDIDIGFSIENSIGADARFTLNDLSSFNTRTGITVPLSQHPIIGSPVNLNRAVDNNGNVTSSTYSVSFNPSNSNIKQFVENLPDKMSYQLDLEINPLGNVSGGNDFIYYDKLMKTNFNMTIPLSLIANNLTLADTMDFKMDESTNNVNHGTLYLYAENGFPFTAEAQLYLMDTLHTIVDSLISAPNIILAPQLDANRICAGKRLTKLSIPVSADKMNLLRSTKIMYLKMKFNTAGQPNYVKIYSFYEMNVKLVGDFNYTVGNND